MGKELVVIFEPDEHNNKEYLILKDPIEELFKAVVKQFPNTLKGQFRIFPYLISPTEYTQKETGILYTRGENDNPLTRIDKNSLVSNINRIARDIRGITECDEKGYFGNKGRIRTMHPDDELYIKALMYGLELQFHQFGIEPPREIRRFILNLDEIALKEYIIPYLTQNGYTYNQIEIAKVN